MASKPIARGKPQLRDGFGFRLHRLQSERLTFGVWRLIGHDEITLIHRMGGSAKPAVYFQRLTLALLWSVGRGLEQQCRLPPLSRGQRTSKVSRQGVTAGSLLLPQVLQGG
jgi:hypothetical protein